MTNKTTNTIEVFPTVRESERCQTEIDATDLNLSEQLSKLFPDVQQQINEPDVGAHPKIELEDLSNILSKIDRGQLPL